MKESLSDTELLNELVEKLGEIELQIYHIKNYIEKHLIFVELYKTNFERKSTFGVGSEGTTI